MSTVIEPSVSQPAGSDSTTVTDSEALLNALTRVMRLVYFPSTSRTELVDLPIAQVRCLNALGEREGDRLVELAARTALTLPAASRTVDKLVRRGLVLRLSDPDDRRALRLFLSDAGKDLLDRVRQARLAHLNETVRNLSEQELADLLRSLTTLASAAADQQSSAPGFTAPIPPA